MKAILFAVLVLLCAAAAALLTRGGIPAKQVPAIRAAPEPELSPRSTVRRQVLNLPFGVEYTVEVNVGATVGWLADDNPLFAKGEHIRPVSVMGIAVWKDIVVSTTHVMLWRKLDSEEGIGSEVSVLGTGFSSEPDVPPRSLLTLDVRPRSGAWGKVQSAGDIAITATLEESPAQPLEHPTPMVPDHH